MFRNLVRNPYRLLLLAFAAVLIVGGGLIWSDWASVLGGTAMLGALDTTSYDPALKSHYNDKRVFHMADDGNPFAGRVPRETDGGGRHFVVVVNFGNPTGGSATFATAQTNAGASKYEDFVVTWTKNYQVADIDNMVILASEDDANAFEPALKEIDRAFSAAGNRDAYQLFRTKGGAKGVIGASTTLASPNLVLDDPADAFNFQIGELIAFADADGTGSLLDSGDTIIIDEIDREAGTLVLAEDIDTVASIATGDYIFAAGDFGLSMAGLESWLPVTDRATQLSTSFYGVTRSVDKDRLGGIYRDGSGEELDETLQKLVASVSKHGGRPNEVYLNPERLSDLLLIIGEKSRYTESERRGRAGIGFQAFDVIAGGLKVALMGDRNCPSKRLYALQMDTWVLKSMKKTPQFLDRTGLLRAKETSDAYEVRVGGYRNLGCYAPGYNGVALLS